MSVDHSYRIKLGNAECILTITGLNEDERDLKDISFHLGFLGKIENPAAFNLSLDDMARLYRFLDNYPFLKDTSMTKTGSYTPRQPNQKELLSFLETTDKAELTGLLKSLIIKKLSKEDINTILGRKEAISVFEKMLSESHTETEWQIFFEQNAWIFGFGLRYKYLKILQREAHISNVDIDGTGQSITDYLLADNFTKIVELKKPTTPLFENDKYRNGAWKISNELTYAISQILAQKAEWNIKSLNNNYDTEGNIITQATHDPECILIIGNLASVEGTDKEKRIKLRTFELFRRNLRNLEILCYDELLKRAKYLISNDSKISLSCDSNFENF